MPRGLPNIDRLTAALRLADDHIHGSRGLFRKLSLRLSASKRPRATPEHCRRGSGSLLNPRSTPTGRSILAGVGRTWLTRTLSVAEALSATAEYRKGLTVLRELRSRDEVARQLRRVRNDITDAGAEIVALYARLAPDRLETADRQAIGNFRALLEQLAGRQMGARAYAQLRNKMTRLFPNVSRHIPAWCVTNLSAGSLPLEPNLFDLLIVDEASQCDIPSALPLLYRSKRAVIIGDARQLKHITKIDPHRSQQLLDAHGWGDDNSFGYNNSLFDLSISRSPSGAIMLQDHYRSHSDIVGFSNRKWYDGNLQTWTDYDRLKNPPGGRFGIRWTDVSGTCEETQGRQRLHPGGG